MSTNLLCQGQGCGQKFTPSRRRRVVGGSESEEQEWPWAVAISAGDKVFCGGTLVGDVWVVTAGHCVQDYVPKPHLLSVIAGVNDLNDPDKHVRHVVEVSVHPDYRFIFNADIAILRLSRPFEYSSSVRAVCLPWNNPVFSSASHCVVAGWGVYDMNGYYDTVTSPVLRHVKTKMADHEACRMTYRNKMEIKDTMVCAGYTGGGMDACKGDSGGPLMCETGGGRWVLAGVISWGEMCGSVQKPGVYTRVSSFIDWIDQTTKSVSGNSINCTFESSDWCGYNNAFIEGHNDSNSYIWTRKPSRRVDDHYLYATRVGDGLGEPDIASLLLPRFTAENDGCLTFSYMFSTNSNITLSLYVINENQSLSKQAGSHSVSISGGKILWSMTGDFPYTEKWMTTEVDIKTGSGRLQFVATHDNGAISGVSLDNIGFTNSQCKQTKDLACDFDDETLCNFSLQNLPRSVSWIVEPKGDPNQGFVAFAGGGIDHFGYMSVAKLVSPLLDYGFTQKQHCLQFSFNKNASSSHELLVCTYLEISGSLAGRQEIWSSKDSPIGVWATVHLNIKRGYYNFIAFVVQRTTYDFDFIGYLLDEITVTDGYCV